MSNFILVIEEVQSPRLVIALKWFGGVTEFIDLADSAFVNHPAAPTYYNNFAGYEDAYLAKQKWNNFLDHYLDKKV